MKKPDGRETVRLLVMSERREGDAFAPGDLQAATLRRTLSLTASFSRMALMTEETAVATNMTAINAAIRVSVAYIIVIVLSSVAPLVGPFSHGRR